MMLALGDEEMSSAIDCLLVFEQDKNFGYDFHRSYWESRRSIFEVPSNCLLDHSINYPQLKSWVKQCDEEHGHWRAYRTSHEYLSLEGFQLLDVGTGHVVPATERAVRYAALSYVWGLQSEAPTSNDEQGYLFPTTIKDAMEVTKQLGLGFLWVDRYCIPQDDDLKKNHQIKNMHRIYQQAHFTIVAAAGNGPDRGLPGVSSQRALAPHLLVDNRLFVANAGDPRPEANVDINKSPWNSRAWTYQEKVFSRRILYFTETEVVFHCKSDFHGVDNPTRNYLHPGNRPLIGRIKRRGPVMPQALLLHQAFDELTREFNRRQITREADRLNAIAGVLSDMESRGKIHGHVTGVLIFREYPHSLDNFFGLGYLAMETKNWDAGFLTGLCWTMQKCKGRRNEFPSWSWIGWNGLYHCNAEIRPDLSSLKFELELNSSKVAMLQKRNAWSDHIDKDPDSPDIYFARSEQLWLIQSSGVMEESMCRFIHIKAAVVNFTCKMDVDNEWRLASLMGIAIHEETMIPVQFLKQEDFQLPISSTFEKFLGLVFFKFDWKSIFVIVLRDCGTFYERRGSWTAHTSILFPPEVDDGIVSKMTVRDDKDCEESLALTYPIEQFIRSRLAYVRLG
ncbi:HET-domain-containing protein [Corynespora cassiicola Philippines]|uniref:HET-domain-containing protein n=1 Tax=Corynespora cassiicola Philippines TaxID=1448308 RepID=A0A2T2N7C6_CORCC|nr:HET-domain-containing protein [Corynespora cassiicola Philippines]